MALPKKHAAFTDLDTEIPLIFQDLQLEYVECDLCGDHHPPEMHLRPLTPMDPLDPEDA